MKEIKSNSFVLYGDICYSETKDRLFTKEGGYLVSVDGVSMGVFDELPEEYRSLPLIDHGGKLIIPGMVDMHIHAPQFAYRGTDMDLELMDWLSEKTFPEEAKYRDTDYAERAYSIFADAMRRGATTHAAIFATKHKEATELLMDKLEAVGIVSYVGKVNMDREAPPELCEASAEASAEETVEWLEAIKGKYKLTKPILTPRFIPCCSKKLLDRLGEIQIEYDLPVQSHLSENQGEVEFVRRLAPKSAFYGDAYDYHGLFGTEHTRGKAVNTIMAHCVYSTEDEMQRMKENGVFVAHCPASNINLSSGIAPIRKYLDLGLRMGLGSDVAGGHTDSMFEAICDAVQVSKLYWRLVDQSAKPLSFAEAFYLATRGGGEFFGRVGGFDAGYELSAVVLDDGLIERPMALSIKDRVESAAYCALDLYGISAKYVRGVRIA